MNFKHLRIFFYVSESLNMSHVAKQFYISQSAVSQIILDLERHFKTKLFDRIGRNIFLTDSGKIFKKYVRRILNLYDESTNTISEMNSLERGSITIGASTTIGIYVLPKLIKRFKKIYDKIDISIIINNTQNIAELLLKNKIDFAYVEGNINFDELNFRKIWNDNLVFIVPFSKKWKNKKFITPSDLKKEKIIMREKGSGTREIFENYMKIKKINYNIQFELGNTEAIKKAVENNMGISCISEKCITEEIKYKKLFYLNFRNFKISRHFNLIYHRDKYMSELFLKFISLSEKFDI